MSLRNDVLHSLKWLAGARLASQIVAWVVTIAVIRILAPSDYGLLAMAELMIGFAALFRQMGIQTAVVQKSDITKRQIEQCFGILLGLNVVLYGILFLSAPWIASFFNEPRLVSIIRVLGIRFPLGAVGSVQGAILSRRMAFKRKSFVQFSSSTTNSIVTLALALSGAGVWSLVYGALSSSVVRAAGITLAARYWCWPRFSLDDMASIIRFGSFVTASKIIWYVYSRADVFFTGKLLGTEALGFYNIAMELASLPQRKTSAIFNQVGLAAYSSIQDDMPRLRSHYLKVIRTLGFVAFPIFWGISSIAPQFVPAILGERWSSAIVPLQILGIVMPIQMLSHGSGAPITAIGKPHLGTLGQVFALLIMPPAFLIGAWYGGLVGVSLAWVTGYPLLVLIRLRITLPALGLGYMDYFGCLTGPLLGGLCMLAVVNLVHHLVAPIALSPVTVLIAMVASGALAYTLFMWFFRQQDSLEFISLVKR